MTQMTEKDILLNIVLKSGCTSEEIVKALIWIDRHSDPSPIEQELDYELGWQSGFLACLKQLKNKEEQK